MRTTLLLLAVLTAGCASWGRETYSGTRTTPYVEEHLILNEVSMGRYSGRVLKRILMHNPTVVPVDFVVRCASIMQGPLDETAPPKTTLFAIIEAVAADAYYPSCRWYWMPQGMVQ